MAHPYDPNGVVTIADNLRLRAEVDQLRKERDEARRLASEYACITEMGVRAFARNKGWDCFKEDNHNA